MNERRRQQRSPAAPADSGAAAPAMPGVVSAAGATASPTTNATTCVRTDATTCATARSIASATANLRASQEARHGTSPGTKHGTRHRTGHRISHPKTATARRHRHGRQPALLFVLGLAGLWVMALAGPLDAQGAFSSIAAPQTSVRDILTGPQNRPRADTYYLLGLAAARKNNHAEALRQIAIGLRLAPDHLRLLSLRAAVWARQGRTAEAIAEFRRLARLYPGDEYITQSLRELERPLQPRFAPVTSSLPPPPAKRDSPVAPVDTTRPASPTRLLEATYFERMKLKQRCCYQMAAIKRAQEAQAAAVPSKKAAFDLQALVESGRLSARPVCPEGGEYGWAGGPTCSKHGDFATVEAEVTTVFADFNRGLQNKISRHYPAALQAFEQVCALYPQWSEAHFQRGETLFRLGNDRAAIEAIRRSLQCDPGNLDAKLLLANLLFKVGHKEAALELLDGVATGQAGTVYGLAARSVAKAIRSGRNYYQVFPPD